MNENNNPTLKRCSVINLSLVMAISIFFALGCASSNPESQDTSANKNAPKIVEETDDFKKLNSAEHLAEAKKLIGNKPSEYELNLIAKHLKAIPETAPEYKEAESLLKQTGKNIESLEKDKQVEKDALQVVGSSWRRGAFGAAGIWNVTFYNRSDKPIGDIEYRTRYYSETGNDVGGTGGLFSSGEVQKIIPPRQKRTVKINDGFIHREAASGSFKVTSWRFLD